MSSITLQRDSFRFLAASWGLVMGGAIVLLISYANLSDTVVVYRPPWADAPETAPKTWINVARIALMGMAQLGAATAMIIASRDSVPWERFWRWLALVAGVKTLLECVGLVMPQGSTIELALAWTTFALVGVFGIVAAWWWKRGEFQAHPDVEGWPKYWLIASLTLWAVFAAAPRFSQM